MMAVIAYRSETAFVRGCARTYASEIGFSREAESQMARLKVFWSTVYQVLIAGRVIWSDKDDAEDTKSILIGADCDGDRLRLSLKWSASEYNLLVVSVERL